ncbi:hypothetical protein [Rhodanobacter sp. FW106-PBR-LB-2-11]|uniref:hypothetical protein n=1 Tax=Rhodanobacter sp. FW106-PBR-LB-2-11 TaxID=1524463 RepID=UPI0034E3F7C9
MDSKSDVAATTKEVATTRVVDAANKGEAWAQAHGKSIRLVTWLILAGLAVLWFVKHH